MCVKRFLQYTQSEVHAHIVVLLNIFIIPMSVFLEFSAVRIENTMYRRRAFLSTNNTLGLCLCLIANVQTKDNESTKLKTVHSGAQLSSALLLHIGHLFSLLFFVLIFNPPTSKV